MLWEHEPQASVSTAFLSSPKIFFFFMSVSVKQLDYEPEISIT